MNFDYYSNIIENMDNKWKVVYGGKNVKEIIKEYLVIYLGELFE